MDDNRARATISVDIRADGIYLVIDNPVKDTPVNRKEVLQVITDCEIQEIDFSAVNEIFKIDAAHIEQKISATTHIKKRDETATIEVSKDKMEAYIQFYSAGHMGETLTPEKTRKIIDDNGVKYGIMNDILEGLTKDRQYTKKHLFACGTAPIDGKDGYLDYKFNTGDKTNKPKILDDGRVDFRQIDYFDAVKKSQILMVAIPPAQGGDGTNVLNQVVSHKPGKPAPKFPGGKNVELSEDGTKLLASISGHLILNNNKITISPVLTIDGDVGPATGNVNFEGSVDIKGHVMTGFSIIATGNIAVNGVVEGAYIESDADINLYNGIQGAEKATIKAGGDIFTKFAQNCTLIAKGDIVSDSIMHCNVRCDGSIKMDGKKCLLVGGTISVGHQINAKTIGSSMATVTDISVGNSPELLQNYNLLKEKLAAATSDYEKISVGIDTIMRSGSLDNLPPEKKELLLKSIHAKTFLREKVEKLQTQTNEALQKLSSNNGVIRVSDVIYSGAKVLIGDALMYVRDDIHACTLRNIDGKVAICPL